MKKRVDRIGRLILLLLLAFALPPACEELQAQGLVMEPPRAAPMPAAAKALLEKADELELFSLDPERATEKPKDNLHGYKVLGKITVKDLASRKKLVEAFEKANTEFRVGFTDSDKEQPATGFNPRHGIRVTRNGAAADFVISFASYQTKVFVDGQKAETFLVSRSPMDSFDELLKEAGIPMAKAPDYAAARIQELERTVVRLENQLRTSNPAQANLAVATMAQVFGMMGFVFGMGALAGVLRLRKEIKQLRDTK